MGRGNFLRRPEEASDGTAAAAVRGNRSPGEIQKPIGKRDRSPDARSYPDARERRTDPRGAIANIVLSIIERRRVIHRRLARRALAQLSKNNSFYHNFII